MVSISEPKGYYNTLTVQSEGYSYSVPYLGYDPELGNDWSLVCDFGNKKVYTATADYVKEGYAFQLVVYKGKFAELKLEKLEEFCGVYLPKGYSAIDYPGPINDADDIDAIVFAYKGEIITDVIRHHSLNGPVIFKRGESNCVALTTTKIIVELAHCKTPKYALDVKSSRRDTGVKLEEYNTISDSILLVKRVGTTSFRRERLNLAKAVEWLFDYRKYEKASEATRTEVTRSLNLIARTQCYRRIHKMLLPHRLECWRQMVYFARDCDGRAEFVTALMALLTEVHRD